MKTLTTNILPCLLALLCLTSLAAVTVSASTPGAAASLSTSTPRAAASLISPVREPAPCTSSAFLRRSSSPGSDPQDPDAVATAMALLIRKHSVNADTIAVEISNRFSKSAAMQTALARAYYRNNERQRTRHYLNKAIQADNTYEKAYLLYGEMYGEWDVDSACYWYEKAILAQPTKPEAYVRYANVMSRKDMNRALSMLEQLRAAIPHYNVDVEISALYNKKGDDKAAVAAMENTDVGSLTMNQLAAYLQNCYWAGDDQRAIEVAQVGMERFPENKGFNRLFAWSSARTGAYQEALDQELNYLSTAPEDSINSIDYLTAGSAYMALNKTDKAFETFAKINDLKDDYFAPQMKGQIAKIVNRDVERLKGEGNYEGAADIYRKYIATYPNTSDPAYQQYALSQIYRDQVLALSSSTSEETVGEPATTSQASSPLLTALKNLFSIYTLIEEKYPNWENIHYVLYTHARWTYSYLDKDNSESLALPYYEKLYKVLINREKRNEQEKAMIVEACQYMGSDSYFQKHDVATARIWWQRILNHDPNNQTAKDALAKIKK